MKSILVPVDFSKDSINALDHAISIANKLKATIRIIHVRKDKNYDDPFIIKGKEREYGKTVEEFMHEIIQEYKPKYKGGGGFDYSIKVGKIYKAITDRAEEDHSFLIVMGTHGVSGFEETWLGSNAYRVVCKAPCPVLTVRSGFKQRTIKKIVVPIDAHRETRKKVPFAAEIAAAFGAEVHIVAVRTTNRKDIIQRLKKYVDQSAEYLEKKRVKVVKDEVYGSNIADLTYSYGVHIGAQIISIVSNERGTPINMPISTTAQQMVNHSPIPVLSMHPTYVK